MVEIRKKIEAKSKVGLQGTTLRTTIPQQISKYIHINAGDELKWKLDLSKKPVIMLEIIESEKKGQEK